MMKKIFILFIAILYLGTASGVVMNIHYCMGKISSVNFGHEKDHEDGSCSKCGMDKTENHCCKDETQYVKLSDSHQASSTDFFISDVLAAVPVCKIDISTAEQGNTKIPSTSYFSPPPKNLNKVYLAVNVFRI
jgi:hypothetical protein